MTIWAITCYFNPKKFKRRYFNYLTFRKILNLPLLTIEWAIKGEFQLNFEDADLLLQVSGGHLMWQKERLLNIAIAHLPTNCDRVAWLDCDIVFEDNNWINMLCSALRKNNIVQLFSQVIHCHPLPLGVYNSENFLKIIDRERSLLVRESLISFDKKQNKEQIRQRPNCLKRSQNRNIKIEEENEIIRLSKRPSSGHAWGANRKFIQENILYDACICGVGDMAIALAVLNLQELFLEEYPLNKSQKLHYKLWADRFAEQVNGKVDYLPCDILHLFHGELINRQYRTRLHTLAQSDFDPSRDIVLDEQGLWRWNSEKPTLKEFMDRYFELRSEDS